MHDVPAIEFAMVASQPAPAAYSSRFVGGVWNPEDLARLEGTRWVVVSAMRSSQRKGALLAVDATAPNAAASDIAWRPEAESGRRGAADFAPHGIEKRALGNGQFEVLVVDHGGGEAIDRLTIDATGPRPVIVAGARIEQPAGTSGNAVAAVPGGGFVMTSMFDPRDPKTLEKFAAGQTTGGVWRWDDKEGWRRVGPDLSGANGIAVSADGHTIFVSEWSARRVWKLSIDGDVLGRIDVDFLPDNLRWKSDGSLLLAGQVDKPERVFGCAARGEPCPLAFAVARLDPATMKLTTLIHATHEEATTMGFGGATGALQVGDELWVGSFTGEHLLRYRSGEKWP